MEESQGLEFTNCMCDFCNKEINQTLPTHTVFRVLVITEKQNYYYGLVVLCNDLNKYLFDIGCHLSATQVILMRPDILKQFLEVHFKDIIIDTILDEAYICDKCFDEWKKEIPSK